VYRDTLHTVIMAGILFSGHKSFVVGNPCNDVILLLVPLEYPVVETLLAVPDTCTCIPTAPSAMRSGTAVPSKSAKMLMLCGGRSAMSKRRW
jgi:hypothetical protein